MNNEEFDRKLEFIVNQQAQFLVDIQRLQETQAQTDQTVAQTAKHVESTAESLRTTIGVVDHLATVTHEAFRFVFESFKQTNATLDALVDSQVRTDERLRDLTVLFDRHIREGHKGLSGA